MKRILFMLTAMILLMVPLTLLSEEVGGFETSGMQEYTGDLDDPGCLIIHRSERLLIVKVNGVYFFYRCS